MSTLSNAQKTPLSKSLNAFAQTKALEAIDQLGKALPGHVVAVDGAIVTVAFDVNGLDLPQVVMPVFGPIYVRYPIQAGDLGVAFPASLYLGGVSGLGGGIADDTPRGSLSCLVWFPVGNSGWAAPSDPNAVIVQGPNGVVTQDIGGKTVSTLTPQGITESTPAYSLATTGAVTANIGSTFSLTAQTSITLAVGGHSIVINESGVTIDGKVFLSHIHDNVQAGTQLSGPVY